MAVRPPKPEHAPWLMPYLTVSDPEASLKFYQKAFGFEPQADVILKGPDGKIMHAEMRFHGATIMFGPEGCRDNPARTPAHSGTAPPMGLYIYCEDVDALFQQAKAAGAKVQTEPQDMFWGDRMCTLIDPDGFQWSFATNVADFDPSKIPTGPA